ncbi:MAG: hypothetical protein UT63_C0056G0004 [Candidatus Gottesmanbacteria bacterium GW2011_GWC2_39_8]|uniref:Uncharacterized protein n=1 Tax=Candidatus Gottesmanbacteria bacterium GW2011_GWC2_39_8 TaxID=1618450 RepID=A0A0G0SB25_9BACT|nr:MAG: hypothetical protein UT63_C0056G0004 [Candidatus Gottesmanbacteria bacterium GW2011_GWC2_39_8]
MRRADVATIISVRSHVPSVQRDLIDKKAPVTSVARSPLAVAEEIVFQAKRRGFSTIHPDGSSRSVRPNAVGFSNVREDMLSRFIIENKFAERIAAGRACFSRPPHRVLFQGRYDRGRVNFIPR